MKTITTLLIAALICLPLERPKAQIAPAVFVLCVVGLFVVGGYAVYLKTCKPKIFCVKDPADGHQWCRPTTRREAQLDGLTIVSGPYADGYKCAEACGTNAAPQALDAGDAVVIHVEKSFDLVTWREVGAVTNTVDNFEWSETNRLSTACFYRAWY